MKISIVIPVYNAGKYLKRCLDSVFRSLGDIDGEVLAINNNSTDDSLEIMEQYAKNETRLKVLSHKPIGASSVRNHGAKLAKGEYIWFIDGDDEIAENAIPELLKTADKKKADIVMMGARRIHADGHEDYFSAVDPKTKDYKHRFVRYGMGPWQAIFRREWWNENFKFTEGMIHEDMELMSSLILYTDNFACVDKPFYLYYQNPDSVLHQKKWNGKAFDIFKAMRGIYGRFEKKDAVEEYRDDLEWFFIWNLLIDSAKDFAAFPEGKPGFKRTRELLKEYFPHWRNNKFLKQKSWRFKLRVCLNYFGIC